jgi:hypothetical protein
MARGGNDRLRRAWRALNDDEWRYSPRGLVSTWAISVVVLGLVFFLVLRDAGEALGYAVFLPTVSLALSWWRSKHRPAPRPPTRPAWYPDPSGRHERRYWDGAQWTENVLDGRVQSVDS